MLSGRVEDEMLSNPRRDCYLCGSVGEVLHAGLRDAMGNVPGTWSFLRCRNPVCGLIWLNPVPLVGEIHKAYRTYYTHGAAPAPGAAAPRGHQAGAVVVRGLSALLREARFYGRIRREHGARDAGYLGDLAPGRLLEVGCGDGGRLRRMNEMGWDGVGQEVDPVAADVARAQGVEVRVGALETVGFPPGWFDAVLMAHTIEHVHDPVGLLTECRRILRSGGRLVVITPNAESYGHRRFGASWQGLDPPRHLFLFTQRSLRNVALRAGFAAVRTWTTEANSFPSVSGSLRHQRYGTYLPTGGSGLAWTVKARAFQYWTTLMLLSDEESGEECVLSAQSQSA